MISKVFSCIGVAVFLFNGVAAANCDDSTSTQRATVNSQQSTVNSQQSTVNSQQSTVKRKVEIDEKNGTITINGETRKIESLLKKIDKNKKMSRGEFELLKKTFGVDLQNSSSASRVGCIDGYMNLGIYGAWTWGAYMEDEYFWSYLFGTTVPPFTPLPVRPIAVCEAELAACLAEVQRASQALENFCSVAAGAAGAVAVVVSPPASGAAILKTYGACQAGKSFADAKATQDCMWKRQQCFGV